MRLPRVLALLATLFVPSTAMADAARAPAAAKAVWADPAAADRKARNLKGDGDPFYYDRPFQLSPNHIALMRQARFIWDTEEAGVPALDPLRPYGQVGLMAQLAAIFGKAPPAALAMRHVEMVTALRIALRRGTIAPGEYTVRNIDLNAAAARINKHRAALGEAPVAAGFGADGRFKLSEEHIKLLKVMSVRWAYDEAIGAMSYGEWPTPRIDSKRPYGDRTGFALDMAEALGATLAVGPDGRLLQPSDADRARYSALHAEMLAALQVFVENATIEPGKYE